MKEQHSNEARDNAGKPDRGPVRDAAPVFNKRTEEFKKQLSELLAQPDREMRGSFGFANGRGGTDYVNVDNHKDFAKMIILLHGEERHIKALEEIVSETEEMAKDGVGTREEDTDLER